MSSAMMMDRGMMMAHGNVERNARNGPDVRHAEHDAQYGNGYGHDARCTMKMENALAA